MEHVFSALAAAEYRSSAATSGPGGSPGASPSAALAVAVQLAAEADGWLDQVAFRDLAAASALLAGGSPTGMYATF